MNLAEREKLHRIFNPRGIAVFGRYGGGISFAQMMLMSQIRYGYDGRLYPISPNGGEIAGLKIYKSLGEIKGGPIDLASISIPAKTVPGVLRECLEFGIAGAQIHSSGFAETGEAQDIRLQEEILQIAQRGIRIIGPNGFGIHCPKGKVALLPGGYLSKQPGPVGMISQSGGGALKFAIKAQLANLPLSKLISFGNGCDLDAIQLLEYLAKDPETQYIGAYLEGVNRGREFLEILRKTTSRKPVVIWKGGLTPLGNRATQSHTGSLGGQALIWNGALRQAGAIPVLDIEEMVDTLAALKYLRTRGKRIAVVGGGGALGVFTSDLAYSCGLEIPFFSQETQEWLKPRFPTPGNSVLNPLDTGSPAFPPDSLIPMIQRITAREPIDIAIIITLLHAVTRTPSAFMDIDGQPPPPDDTYMKRLLKALPEIKRETGKEVVMIFENWEEDGDRDAILKDMRIQFQKQGIPVFPSMARALRAIQNISWIQPRGTHTPP